MFLFYLSCDHNFEKFQIIYVRLSNKIYYLKKVEWKRIKCIRWDFVQKLMFTFYLSLWLTLENCKKILKALEEKKKRKMIRKVAKERLKEYFDGCEWFTSTNVTNVSFLQDGEAHNANHVTTIWIDICNLSNFTASALKSWYCFKFWWWRRWWCVGWTWWWGYIFVGGFFTVYLFHPNRSHFIVNILAMRIFLCVNHNWWIMDSEIRYLNMTTKTLNDTACENEK